MDLSFLTHETDEQYHAKSLDGTYLSSHLLMTFRKSPKLYYDTITGNVKRKDTTAFAFGRAVHKIVLEGMGEFQNEFLVSDGPVNPKTGECFSRYTNAYKDWKALQDRQIVSTDEFNEILKLFKSVNDNKVARELLGSTCGTSMNGVAEGVVRADLDGVPCQIKCDFITNDGILIDLKTCADIDYFESDARKYSYILQMAFYRQVLMAKTGRVFPVKFIAVEKEEPYRCGVWDVDTNALNATLETINMLLKDYRKCKKTDTWPTGYEEIRTLYYN